MIRRFAIPALALIAHAASGADGNRLAHLDEPNNPWQFDFGSPKLVTPQWIGEEAAEAVVVLAIDDMRGDGQRFVDYLGPIIDRLKRIDGRGPASITCNRLDPTHPNMQWFLEQGVSLEAHTMTHPCPLLQRGNFEKARGDYELNVDLLCEIPNHAPVGFRFPCMDGTNTPSPRAYAEFLNGVTRRQNFLFMSTSVGVVFTPEDGAIPKSMFAASSGGTARFSRYLTNGFVNYIENYPYPFVVGNLIWELPFVYPNDYTGHVLHGDQHPDTMADFKAAIDVAVAKQGAVSLCFHAGSWMRPGQMVDIIDHADRNHGWKVKFLNMREVHGRLVDHMLAGHPLRNAEGGDNGVRIFDIDNDGYMDVLIANEERKVCRIWRPKQKKWREIPFPAAMSPKLRFGVLGGDAVAVAVSRNGVLGGWRFTGTSWRMEEELMGGIDFEALRGNARLRDIDGDGNCELIDGSAIYRMGENGWKTLPFRLPEGTTIESARGGDAGLRFADLDGDGGDDVIFSDGERFGTWMFESMEKGWTRVGLSTDWKIGKTTIPPIVRTDGTNNGAWIKRGHLYWQNEDTGGQRPFHIDKRRFADLMGAQTEKPRPPQASLKAMQPRPGFTVELVAAEPLVMDPVDIAWGPDGKMWVCEMADYPIGMENNGTHGSRIAFLTDADGDGTYDARTLFADGLGYATSVLPWRDGALVVAAPSISFMRDTDGDGRADEHEVLYEGFGEGNQQHRVNGLAWGLDGWLYVANGDSGGTVRSVKTGKTIELGGFDLRIRPDTGEIERATGKTQHGRNRDDWGHWIAGNNSGAWQIVLEDRQIRRNPHVDMPGAKHRLLGVIDLYPASRVLSHWSGYRPPPPGAPGKLTSACGFTFHRDDLFDDHIGPSIYFSCPVHNCLHREVIRRKGVLLHTERAHDEATTEFLRSADSWFRPTAIRTGPDGAMYVADMYRLVIEHPKWIDPTQLEEMKADGRLRAGEKHGRIYRILPVGSHPREIRDLAAMTPAELAVAFQSANGWQRDTAHMMLTWLSKEDQQQALPALRSLLRLGIPVARAQAVSALASLEALTPEDVRQVLGFRSRLVANEDSGILTSALRAAAPLLREHSHLVELVVNQFDHPDPRVRMEAAFALGEAQGTYGGPHLGRFLLANAKDPYLRAAGLASAIRFPDVVLSEVLAGDPSPVTMLLVNDLVAMIAADEQALRMIPAVLARIEARTPYEAWQFVATARLLDAIESEDLRDRARNLVSAAETVLADGNGDLETRIAAVPLVAQTGPSMARLFSLLKVSTPIELQIAAAKALAATNDPALGTQLLGNWSRRTPALRNAIIDELATRPSLIDSLLDAIGRRSEIALSLSPHHRQALLASDDATVRQRAQQLLGNPPSEDRAEVIRNYATALSNPGDAGNGKTIFAQVCAPCHRLDGVGNAIAPDLAALTDRSPESYLTAILDPNRAVLEHWLLYTAELDDGRTLLGALAEETSASVTLVGIDGSHTRVARPSLASLQSTGRSLMPEGLESMITIAQMADLLAYLRGAGESLKTFPNNAPKLVHQSDDRSVTLSASLAEIHGPSIVFEQKYRNLGWWSHANDRAEWTFHAHRGGEFDVWIDWALDRNAVGGTISFRVGDQSLAAPVPSTETWDNYRWGRIGRLQLSAGRHRLVVTHHEKGSPALIDLRTVRFVPRDNAPPQGGADWPGIAPTKPPECSSPYGGRPHAIPGRIEAEHYDEGPPRTAYHDTDVQNQGADYRENTEVDIEKRSDASNGHGIGWTKAGEWLLYTVEVAETGTYSIEMPVASNKQGGVFHLEIAGEDITGTIRIPDTGGWTRLQRIRHENVKLQEGTHTIKAMMDEEGPSKSIGDIDYFEFSRQPAH